jgi:hypothetical protein
MRRNDYRMCFYKCGCSSRNPGLPPFTLARAAWDAKREPAGTTPSIAIDGLPTLCWNLWLAGRFIRRVWTWGKEMMSSRMTRIGVVASFCSGGLLLVGVATSASSPSFSPPKSRLVEPPTSTVERSHKGDRLMHFQTSGGASYSIAVEVTATSNVIVRDKGGNIVFAVDQSSRTTTVGKQIKRRAVVPGPGEVERELPDGCEGAFSPYTEPSKARIIGRCVS